MTSKNMPSYILMCGVCLCIVLLFAARHHRPSRNKIQQIWHGKVFRKTHPSNPAPHPPSKNSNGTHPPLSKRTDTQPGPPDIESTTGLATGLTVGIVTLHTSPNAWCDCGINSIRKYAKKHAYHLEVVHKTVSSVQHPKFQKYHEVLEHFDSDLILLLDCDIAITNDSIRVEDIYKNYKNDIIIARDAQWKRMNVPINSGVILFRKSDWTFSILKEMKDARRSKSLAKSNQYLGLSLVDQPVLTQILVKRGEIEDGSLSEWEVGPHVTVVSQRVMNSFVRRGVSFFKTDPIESVWQNGDWLAHVTGSPAHERLKIMQELGACEKKNSKGIRENSVQIHNNKRIGMMKPIGTKAKVWGKADGGKYDFIAKIVQALHNVSIDSFLFGGSAIGAHRNHGWIVGDKDAGLVLMSLDTATIETVLDSLFLKYHIAGNGHRATSGFGYHIEMPDTPQYIDLWLFGDVEKSMVQCIGVDKGCSKWCKRYTNPLTCKAFPKSWLYPVQYVPFGPYLMASAHEEYLDRTYSKTWRHMCGGWQRGNKRCSDYYETQTFVFWSQDEEGNQVATAKRGNEIQHRFVVQNGEFVFIE